MTPAEISQYIGIVLAVIALLAHAKGYFSSGEKTLTSRVEKSEAKLVDHDRRVQDLESEIRHLPDRESVQQLQINMAEMKVQLSVMIKSSEATERATRRVEEFLMKKGADQ